jgi:hypothetical protein
MLDAEAVEREWVGRAGHGARWSAGRAEPSRAGARLPHLMGLRNIGLSRTRQSRLGELNDQGETRVSLSLR